MTVAWGWTCQTCMTSAVRADEHEAFAGARWHDAEQRHEPLTAQVVVVDA